MASLPDGITLDIPDLRVTITPRSDYIVKIQPVDEYHVVTFDTPTITRATSVFVDYAQSASYANSAGSAVSASYAEVSATSSYADNFTVAGNVTANTFVGDGSGLTGLTAEGTGIQTRDDGVLRGVAQILDFTDGIDVVGTTTASISLNRTGSFTGSFGGDGSGLIDIVSASFATTASYADNAGASDWDTLANKPSGLVSSSTQTIANINGQEITPSIISSSGHIVPSTTEIYDLGSTDLRWRDLYLSGSTIYLGSAEISSDNGKVSGSFTGSFTGDASSITGVVSSSYALTASYAENAGVSDWNELTNVPSGLVSSSTQVNADSVTNFDTNVKDKLNADGVISSSAQVTITESQITDLNHYDNTDNLTYLNSLGVISSSVQVDYDSIQNVPSGIVSSSGQIDHDQTTNYSADEHFTQANITTVGTVTSGDVSAILPSGTVSSSAQITITESQISDLTHYTDTDTLDYINTLGVFSSSAQVNADSVTNFDSNILTYINSLGAVSSSTQIDYGSIQNIPSGIISSSAQIDGSQVTGVVSSSYAVTASYAENAGSNDWNDITNIPSGLVSSSVQINTGSFSGSFNGSFVGDGSGLTGIVAEGDTGIQVRDDGSPTGTALILNFADGLDVTGTTTASISLNRTGSFTGSFSGDGSGLTGVVSSSYALSSSYSSTAGFATDVMAIYTASITDDTISFLKGGGGTFQLTVDNVSSSSYADTASYSNTSERSGLNNIPSGLVSSSSQITITESQISDLTHYTDTDTLDYINTVGVFSSSAQVNADSVTNFDSNVLTYINSLGAISSSTQVDYDSIQNVPSGIVSASSFTSPSQGTVRATINGVQTDVDTGLQTGDSPQFTNLTLSGNLTVNGTTTYISSSQVDIGDQIITLNANNASGDGGIYVNDTSTNETGSLLWDVSENYWIAGLFGSESEVITLSSLNAKGVFSSSAQVNADSVTNFDSNVLTYINSLGAISSSTQVDYGSIQNVPSGIVSSSGQIDHDQTTNYNADEHFTQANITTVGTVTSGDISAILPSGTVSSSTQVNADSVTNFDSNVLTYINSLGAISSSTQVDYDSIQNVPSGIISSSAQIDGSQVTGVISSSYAGTASVLLGSVVSSSYAETAATASYFSGSINFPDGLSVTGSFELQGSMSASGDVTASAFVGDGSQITGVVSSSYALTASYAANGGGGGSGTVTSITAGDGLNGGTITTSGTISVDSGSMLSYYSSSIFSTVSGDGTIDSVGVLSVVSSSYAVTASYIEGNIEFINGLLVTGSITASGQVSSSGGFIGDGSQVTGVVSSSYAETASLLLGSIVSASYALTSSFATSASWSPGGSGTVTSVTAGAGLFGGEITSTGTISVDSGSLLPYYSSSIFSTVSGDGTIDSAGVLSVVSSSYSTTASFATSASWAPGGGGVTINNNTDNYLVTATGTAATLDGESKLTFDGTTFNVDGAFTANTKSFLIDHQTLSGKKLRYGVLEGPEHAVYLRGRLTNDDTITFPEEWSWLVDKDSITVQLTTIGPDQHLWVEQITETSITVNSNTDIDCYYLVHATRKDVDPLQTVE